MLLRERREIVKSGRSIAAIERQHRKTPVNDGKGKPGTVAPLAVASVPHGTYSGATMVFVDGLHDKELARDIIQANVSDLLERAEGGLRRRRRPGR